MGHTFNSLGCFLLDLLPYRNKSDSLYYGLLFRGLNLLIKLILIPQNDLSAVPVNTSIKAILIYISQKTSYLQTRFVCHYYTPLFRGYCYIHLFSHIYFTIYTWRCVNRLLSGLYILTINWLVLKLFLIFNISLIYITHWPIIQEVRHTMTALYYSIYSFSLSVLFT